jgi:hypothetical protein
MKFKLYFAAVVVNRMTTVYTEDVNLCLHYINSLSRENPVLFQIFSINQKHVTIMGKIRELCLALENV